RSVVSLLSLPTRRSSDLQALFSLGTMTVLYLSVAYVLVPAGWRFHNRRHALDDAPTRTRTADGIAGDPVNLALVGTETELVAGRSEEHTSELQSPDPLVS